MITLTLCRRRLTRLCRLTLTIISTMQILHSAASPIDANLTGATGKDLLLYFPEEGPSNRPLNLSVSVELATGTDGNSNLSGRSTYGPVSEQANKRIKLVIRWLHPTGKPPEGYNVEVRAAPGNNSSHILPQQPRCSEHFTDYFKHVDISEATRLEMGETTKVTDHLVQFGCSYTVSIQSSPLDINSVRTKLTTTFTVPDCVGGVCQCAPRAHLPAPQSVAYHRIWSTGDVARDVEDRSYELNWSYEQPSNPQSRNDSDEFLASFISVRVEKAENVLALGSIYRQVREYRHPVDRSVGPKKQHFRQVIHHLEARSNFRVRIAAHDAHHCEGQMADLYFNREPHQPVSDKPYSTDYQKETTIGIVAVVGSLLLVATAIAVRLSWKRFLRRLHLIASETTEGHNHTLNAARYSRPPSHSSFYREGRRSTLQTNGQQLHRHHHNLVYHHQTDSEESRNQLLAIGKPIDDYEINPSQLKLGAEIGKGAFGRVHLATAENLPKKPGTTHLVAVKQIKKKVGVDERDDFLAEIAMMKRVGIHPNIVVMLACITVQQPLSMVLEYVPYGDLLHYLRTLRTVYHQSKGLVAEGQQQLLQRGSVVEGPRTELSTNQVASTASSTAALLQPSSGSNMMMSSSSKTGIKQLVRNSSSDSASRDSGSGSRSYHLSHIFSTAPPVPLTTATAPTAASSTNSSSTTHSSASYVFPNYYKGFLNHFPTSRTIDAEELHDFARQIARGMEHLERKGITHRDLAARNLLLSEGRILKISDFGLSRHGVYVNTKKRMLPLRWLAVESMTDNLYSSKSDVWAFGVVLWEICTLGGFPYADVCDAQLMTHLLAGNRLTRPDNVSEKLFEMMTKCWNGQPDERPTFQQLRASLEESETHREAYVDFGCYTNVGSHQQSAYQLVNLPPTEEDIIIAAAADTTTR